MGRRPVVRSGVSNYHADLLDPDAVQAVLADVHPTHLLHLAWDLSSYEGLHHLDWVRASLALLRHFRRNGGRRAVLAGTCFEYEAEHGFCTEDLTPTRPSTFYGHAKSALTHLAHAFADASGLSLATARIFYVYGPHQPSGQLVPYVIESLLAGTTAKCTRGTQIRDYLHVADVAAACVALLDRDVRGAVNVGSGQPTRVRDLVYRVADELGGRDLVALGARPSSGDEPPLLLANSTRLRNEVGWEPARTLSEGIAGTVDWWKQNASTTTPLSHSS
jgi:nucleoside-diphosphate-sugar epimerase